MEYLFAIFGLGFIITLVVAKCILQAHEFANEELEKQNAPTRNEEILK